MTDKFYPVPLKQLIELSLKSINGNFLGIPGKLFFNPDNNFLGTKKFGKNLDTPIGVAAGPHTQLSQNIVAAWLMGARYIELKTVQTLDELEIPKPCIDMQDEGYNCEWSQELKIEQSFNEYLNAWIAIHVLNHETRKNNNVGTIFNMSVGYNLEGILKDNVQWFFNKMRDCSEELHEKVSEVAEIYPEIKNIEIPYCISDNITLSTMHGCPAVEIESIGRHLIEQQNLHTFIKLNPTLLGAKELRSILNEKMNFRSQVPDQAFEHDLKYKDALNIIRALENSAKERNLEFGIKLTNTLETVNNKEVFDDEVKMMYMSGRSLHPLSVTLADKLQNEFSGNLNLSFSGGADAFNVADLISCGFKSITVSTDLLKPGGYMRLSQYLENIKASIKKHNAGSINDFILKTANKKSYNEAVLYNLKNYSESVINNKAYKRDYLVDPNIKTGRKLEYFDCVSAPCSDTCSTHQDIPDYMYYSSKEQFNKAFEVILRTNPFPSVTGMVCDHLCQNKCTRINYDNSLLIREVKRFVSEQDEVKLKPVKSNNKKVAIIGSGPAGMSCAYYLALAGFSVDVFESKDKPGGMVQYAIPGFRLTDSAIEKDFKRIFELGVKIHYNKKVDKSLFENLKKDFSYVFIATGAQLSSEISLEGSNADGVLEPLKFLFDAKAGKATGIGKNVVIIGGGNTAMDAARTAYRLVGDNGKITIVYRRTVNEMPADQGEIKAVIEEGMNIIELTAPEKIILKNNNVNSLLCSKMELKGKDKSGRPKPVKIPDSEYEIECDTIIPAIGQKLDIDFVDEKLITNNTIEYTTQINNVFIGGDALRGASTAINAIGDGRKIAQQIINKENIEFDIAKPKEEKSFSKEELIIKRANRKYAVELNELPLDKRKSFDLVSYTLNKEKIVEEAGRCLYCDLICDICVSVCPNFANFSYSVKPGLYKLQKAVRTNNDKIDFVDDKNIEIKFPYQILNIANFCNECGNCNTFCPTSGAPYKDKPKLFLDATAFNDAENGYMYAGLQGRENLIFKTNNSISTLSDTGKEYIYESDYMYARISKSDFQLKEVKFTALCAKEARFENAFNMSIILKGAKELLSS